MEYFLGGFKYFFMFIPNLGEESYFDEHILFKWVEKPTNHPTSFDLFWSNHPTSLIFPNGILRVPRVTPPLEHPGTLRTSSSKSWVQFPEPLRSSCLGWFTSNKAPWWQGACAPALPWALGGFVKPTEQPGIFFPFCPLQNDKLKGSQEQERWWFFKLTNQTNRRKWVGETWHVGNMIFDSGNPCWTNRACTITRASSNFQPSMFKGFCC